MTRRGWLASAGGALVAAALTVFLSGCGGGPTAPAGPYQVFGTVGDLFPPHGAPEGLSVFVDTGATAPVAADGTWTAVGLTGTRTLTATIGLRQTLPVKATVTGPRTGLAFRIVPLILSADDRLVWASAGVSWANWVSESYVPGSQALFPALSPDGTRLAYQYKLSGGTFDLYVLDLETGAPPHQLTNAPGDDGMPSWSPDGATLVFASKRDGVANQLFTIQADGAPGAEVPLRPGGVVGTGPSWSPDGQRIAFYRAKEGAPLTNEIYLIDAAEGTPVYLADGAHPTWSPDGSRLAFDRPSATTGTDIWTINPDGSNPFNVTAVAIPIADHGERPAWSPDGQWLVYLATDAPGAGVAIRSVTGERACVSLFSGKTHLESTCWAPR